MPEIIKDIERNNNEIVRIEVSEFKGNELINMRIWYQAIDDSGEVTYKPTQKGVTLNIGKYEELRDAVDRLGQYIKDKESGFIESQKQEQGSPGTEVNEPQEPAEED